MVVIHHEHIVEVSADLLGRIHGRIDIDIVSFRECRENAGQHVCLNLGRNIELGADPLFFCSNCRQVRNVLFQGPCHLIKAGRKIAHFIIDEYLGTVIEIAATDHGRILSECQDGFGQSGRKSSDYKEYQ